MKKIFTLSLIILIGRCGFSQPWAEQGAEWYFSPGNPWFFGYTKITNVGDTTINGKQCNMLEKYIQGYHYMLPPLVSTVIGKEYVYEENGVVFYYKNNAFYTLYDFNATVGDTWTITGDTTECVGVDTVIVDSVKTMVINNDTLKALYIHTLDPGWGSGWYMGGVIVEKLGGLDYLFPTIACVTDAGEGGGLRCYSDSSAWSYETGIVSACDYTTGFQEVAEESITISPNPASGFLYIHPQNPGTIQLQIFDATGRIVLKEQNFSKNYIDLGSFENGIYLLKYSIDQNSSVKRIVVQR